MPLSCHSALQKIKVDTDLTVALAGNPNVGKSSIFNQLTGMAVVTANYPGKTVTVNMGTTKFDGHTIGVIDLPGTYAIGAISEDQWVARQAVLDGHPDVVVMIVDATNLARNLYMVLQFLDLGLPIVVALNVVDQAEQQGLITDVEHLSQLLDVPVVPTVATRGEGISELLKATLEASRRGHKSDVRHAPYGRDIEEPISALSQFLIANEVALPYGLSPRAIAILLLEGDPEFIQMVAASPQGKEILDQAQEMSEQIAYKHGEPAPLRIARERHGLAGSITAQVQTTVPRVETLANRLWRYTTAPLTGIPILLIVLAATFAFLFYVGAFLSTVFSDLWAAYVSPLIAMPIHFVLGDSVLAKTLLWGFDAGIEAALAVGIPYVLTFYFLLAVLEDTGYLNSVAFLADRLMHNLGLHGRAIIPLVAGAGCNVPAVISTRVLPTMRERLIASTLITLVPCSARTAVILGAVSLYAGWLPALSIYAIVLVLVGLVGLGLNKVMPGHSTGLVMEMFPFRMPSFGATLRKTWARFQSFVFVAAPIVLVGSIVLGALYETGYIWNLAAPLAPIVQGWLGLPPVAGLTLIFAVLRKELALQLLVTLAIVQYGGGASDLLHFMNQNQIFVYALVNTIYIPCVATIAVLGEELGWRRALLITGFTISLAIIIGGIVWRLLPLFGW
ncbi:MAG: ferrous iron transport protein B [Chloroflexi bacterium]|nr:ferrous iron transport protein B [Chloroflexota bacterium]MCL5074330.1 ferrous iron transport protein B [Chloroflexota bacterium]